MHCVGLIDDGIRGLLLMVLGGRQAYRSNPFGEYGIPIWVVLQRLYIKSTQCTVYGRKESQVKFLHSFFVPGDIWTLNLKTFRWQRQIWLEVDNADAFPAAGRRVSQSGAVCRSTKTLYAFGGYSRSEETGQWVSYIVPVSDRYPPQARYTFS